MSIAPAVLLLLAVVVVIAVLTVAAAVLSGDLRGFLARFLSGDTNAGRAKPAYNGPRYRAKQALLTPGERAFFPVVESVLPDIAQHLDRPPLRAFAKVRLADLIEPDCPGGRGTPYMSWFGRIKSKHVDVVVVDADTFAVACVIELDDRSHRTASTQKSDAVKDEALASAGIPLLRVPARAGYDRRAIGHAIADAIRSIAPGSH